MYYKAIINTTNKGKSTTNTVISFYNVISDKAHKNNGLGKATPNKFPVSLHSSKIACGRVVHFHYSIITCMDQLETFQAAFCNFYPIYCLQFILNNKFIQLFEGYSIIFQMIDCPRTFGEDDALQYTATFTSAIF